MERGEVGNVIRELHRRALEVAEKISEEEKRLIRELAESSSSVIYLGYIPANFQGWVSREDYI